MRILPWGVVPSANLIPSAHTRPEGDRVDGAKKAHHSRLLQADTIQFAGGSAASKMTPEQQAVNRLNIPYPFKVYRRQKDDEQDVVRNYMPRTVKPENLSSHLKGAQLIVLGDLHGSYQKLVETLLATGLATMPPEAAKQFRELSETFAQDIQTEPLYRSASHPLKRYASTRLSGESPEAVLKLLKMYGFSKESIEDIAQRHERYQGYYQQLRPLIQQIRWMGTEKQQLLLIGDVLSDRGPLDFLTLDVIDQIRQGNSKRLITLASNHDHAGTQSYCYSNFLMHWLIGGSLGRSLLMASEGQPKVTASLHPEGDRVRLALRSGWTPGSRQDLQDRYWQYVQGSQLVHYRPEYQTLFTHAPVNTAEISRLNDVLSQRYLACAPTPQLDSKRGLANLGDVKVWQSWANRFWNEYMNQAFQSGKGNDAVEEMLESMEEDQGFLWRRDSLTAEDSLPFLNKGVQALVHGHDRGSSQSPFAIANQLGRPHSSSKVPYTVFNLDQDVRKSLSANQKQEPCSLYVEF